MSGIIGVSPDMRSGVVGNYPDKPAFLVYGGSGSTTVNASSVFPWTTDHFNIGEHFDLSQNRFIVPQTGVYWFSLKAYFYGGDNSSQSALRMFRENSGGTEQTGALYDYQPSEILYNDDSQMMASTMYCYAGDKVGALNGDSAEEYYIYGLSHSTFSGFLIG